MSLGPIDRKFHKHGENDGFVLYEHIIKQFSSFCTHTNINVMNNNEKNHVNSKQNEYGVTPSFVSHCLRPDH